ncbi:angiopoietin-4-like [Protopterus annectens]|uniref:angiopoietin-4-like n=1 Tax=Protopterus annectens TaxID=7888 RepID=UPI001CFA2971|nr:angiopoietin-4-like [Protopterus annectens]
MKALLLLCFIALSAVLDISEANEQSPLADKKSVPKNLLENLKKELNKQAKGISYFAGEKGIEPKYLDCQEIYENNTAAANGEYTIFADPTMPGKKVYCDMSSKGWTLILQRKMENDISFHQDFKMYANGFGETRNSYWLGNEFVHQLTKKNKYLLRVVFRTADGKFPFAEYDYFKLENSTLFYTIRIGSYQKSTAEDGFSSPSWKNKVDNIAFSTSDKDNDLSPANCAAAFKSGWWFEDCYSSILTLPGYIKWQGTCDSETKICPYVKMMIRRNPI